MTRYLVDVRMWSEVPPFEPQCDLLLSAHAVEAASPERALQDAITAAVGLCSPAAPPALDSLQVALFIQEGRGIPERWVDRAEPTHFKLLARVGRGQFHTAAVCFHSDWPLKDAGIYTCEQCLANSYPGNVSPHGDSYHAPGCSQRRLEVAACTLHVGPQVIQELLAWGAQVGEAHSLMKAGGLSVAALRQLFGDALPTMTAQSQAEPGLSRTQLHKAVLSALWESRVSKLRQVAQVHFPDGPKCEGSIWRVNSGGYAALVDGVFWLLEYPTGDDERSDAEAIERWDIKKDRGGMPMLLPLI
jgi:hypothetical protein